MVSHSVRLAQKALNKEEQKLHGGYFYRNATFVDVGSHLFVHKKATAT